MQYFIGIVPTQEYKGKVTEFRNSWKNNSISDVVEPHITLKAQGGLTADKKWLGKVKEVCLNTKPFDIKIDKTRFFGEDILYLSLSSKQLSILHYNIVSAVAPPKELIEKYFELDNFIPHMTLGKTTYGLSKQELRDMARLAEKEISPYPTINVDFVRIYQEIEPNKYVKFEDVPLGWNC
ncbi:2'-5' RNA ligase family protein [Halobacillus yeomjeoni]|uniref:2'-5' RNA ligase family protein n=1 Tax=Halobacillus yeomjeoni TaxID=311194 RepID=A0A931HTU6_9BACI|nr:2'-5' RNA ligase family protein [Halobacillus yeomjeoni]MBH0229091.1 2'-5' RNA ligase family protein [Halobacillus yeomjeoni]